ncbi:MAG: IS110 family transposase [Acidimicrobiales bacterium]
MGKEYVGIDLHRRRSVLYRMDEAGEKSDCVRINNDPVWSAQEVGKAPKGSHVVIEATYGWYWAVDLLQEHGYIVHLSNPHGSDWGHRRVKNDERDARDLADLLRLGRLAEAWIAPPPIRELRELVRFRHKLCNLRTGVKAQAHAVMAKNGILPVRNDMWGESGTAQFDALELPDAFDHRLAVLRDLVHNYDEEIARFDRTIHSMCKDDPGYNAVQAIYGVGKVMAAVFVAEIGEVNRFDSPQALCSWAGLTPLHRESDGKVHRGRITKQGSRLVRWAAIEAVACYHGGDAFTEKFHANAERRGKTRANVAIARKVLTLVYYGLRDGEIRCLQGTKAA